MKLLSTLWPYAKRFATSTYAAICAFHERWIRFSTVGNRPFALRDKFIFDDRQKHSDRMIIVLAGYKKQLWRDVFGRLIKFTPSDIDVCVINSGLINPDIRSLCKEHSWSFLSTKRNCLTLAQNIAIDLHPSANMIYKIDEDIFLTKNFFEELIKTYHETGKKSRCDVGMVAPLLNVNGYCYVKILEKLDMVGKWEEKFGPLFYTEGLFQHRTIHEDPNAAIFMWSLGKLDELNEFFANLPFSFSITPYRFSIGAILFPRKTWTDMGMFAVPTSGCGLGLDEENLCSYCQFHTKAIVISENCLVGHLAFGPQTNSMLKFHSAGHCL